MADLLIRDGLVVTLDAANTVIEDGAVAISAGRIVAVGPSADVASAHPAGRTISARGKAILPGLIDVHAHAGHGLVKTMGGGDGARWTEAVETIYPRGSTPEFWHADAQLAALERLKAGVTTGLSIFGAYGSRTDEPIYADRHCEGYREVGVRSVLAVGSSPPPFPQRFARWQDERATHYEVGFDQQVATCETVIKRWHGAHDNAIRIMISAPVWFPGRPDATPALAEAYLGQAAEMRALSRRHAVGFTQDGHQKGTIRAAHARGLLGPDAVMSHCIDLDPDEVDAIVATDTKIAHNPSSNFSIKGRCPAIELMAAGATVAIGSDGTAPDRSYDMFRHMWQAMHYHRRHFRDARILPPGKALKMVTIDAARALGMEAELGSLESGKRADVILVNLEAPHLYPPNMPLHRLMCFAGASDVDTVVIAGRVAMEGRRVLTIDERAVLEAARLETEAMLRRTGLGAMLATPENFWGPPRGKST